MRIYLSVPMKEPAMVLVFECNDRIWFLSYWCPRMEVQSENRTRWQRIASTNDTCTSRHVNSGGGRGGRHALPMSGKCN